MISLIDRIINTMIDPEITYQFIILNINDNTITDNRKYIINFKLYILIR